MRALSVKQPWAELIARGNKKEKEFRRSLGAARSETRAPYSSRERRAVYWSDGRASQSSPRTRAHRLAGGKGSPR